MRSDLRQVEDKVLRIFEYAEAFDSFDKVWSHLKNREDYPQDWRLPPSEGRPINAIYANGRQDAINIKNWLRRLNDPETHPTLKSFVDTVAPALQISLEQATVTLEAAEKVHAETNQRYWSVGQMINLAKKQIALMSSSIQTVQLLKSSVLYREENGEELGMDRSVVINVNSHNTNSNISSSNASVAVSAGTDAPKEPGRVLWLASNVAKIVGGIVLAVITAAIVKYFGLQ